MQKDLEGDIESARGHQRGHGTSKRGRGTLRSLKKVPDTPERRNKGPWEHREAPRGIRTPEKEHDTQEKRKKGLLGTQVTLGSPEGEQGSPGNPKKEQDTLGREKRGSLGTLRSPKGGQEPPGDLGDKGPLGVSGKN